MRHDRQNRQNRVGSGMAFVAYPGTLHIDDICRFVQTHGDGDAARDKCSVTGCRGTIILWRKERVEGYYRVLRT